MTPTCTTTPHGAFGGSAATRATIIQRLRTHFEAGHQVPATGVRWSDSPPRGTLCGLATHANDAAAYQAATGLSAELAQTHEELFLAAQSQEPAADPEQPPTLVTPDWLRPHLCAWMEAIDPGRNPARALAVFRQRLAGELLRGLPVIGPPGPHLAPLLRRWHALLAEDSTDAAAWAALRQACMLAEEQVTGPDAAVRKLLEAVAWPEQEADSEWQRAWSDFLQDVAHAGIENELEPALAQVHLAAQHAWAELDARAASDPSFDFIAAGERTPAIAAANEPQVQRRIAQVIVRRLRPLVERLFECFVASVADPAAERAVDRGTVPASTVGEVHEIAPGRFEVDVLQAAGLVLVDFWATWCAPCRQFMPTLAVLAGRFAPRVKFTKVDVDEHPELAKELGIRAVPTLMLYRDGVLLERLAAVSRARIEALLQETLA